MTRVVVHSTPGTMDLRSVTSFGVNAKPNSISPFGFFGTGLKYSVAVLVRSGFPLYLATDGNVYSFYQKKIQFREKDFDFIRMKRENHRIQPLRTSYSELSYTTELGKTWKLWQVFRELHSNTLDEGGQTYVLEGESELGSLLASTTGEQRTVIVVVSDEYAEVYDNRHEIFLPEGLREARSGEEIQVLDAPSDYIYYRGVRVLDLKKPSKMTYNFLASIDLTEDRTAKNPWLLEHKIRRFLLTSDDEVVVNRAVTADPDTFEGQANFDYDGVEPSEAFTKAVRSAPAPTPAASRLIKSREPRRALPHPLRAYPRPWRLTRENLVVDADDKPIFKVHDDCELGQLPLEYAVELLNQDLDESDMREFSEEDPEYALED